MLSEIKEERKVVVEDIKHQKMKYLVHKISENWCVHVGNNRGELKGNQSKEED